MAGNDLWVLYRIAEQYYKKGKTQEEISREENISRSQVSRMLDRAKTQGIVRVDVTLPQDLDDDSLEDFLSQNLKLDRVVIARSEIGWKSSRIYDSIAEAAAYYLPRMLRDSTVVGVGWGETVYRFASLLRSRPTLPGAIIVPLMGVSASPSPYLQINAIVDRMADHLRAERYFTNLAIYREKSVLLTVYEQKRLESLREYWDKMDAAVFGLGTIDASCKAFDEEVSDTSRERLMNSGAAGEILSQYYYADGTLLTYDEDYETNAFPLDGMRKVAKRICLAGGINKAESILAAAHAGYYTVLLTDSLTARRLYELVRSEIMR